jgi:hypothetical protein
MFVADAQFGSRHVLQEYCGRRRRRSAHPPWRARHDVATPTLKRTPQYRWGECPGDFGGT